MNAMTRKILLPCVLVLTVLLPLGAYSAHGDQQENTLAAVKRRIDAYNRHDWQDFLKAHHPEVRISGYPDGLLGVGHAHLERVLSGRMLKKEAWVRVEVVRQIVFETYVVSDEIIHDFETDEALEHYVAIYKVEDGVITDLRFL